MRTAYTGSKATHIDRSTTTKRSSTTTTISTHVIRSIGSIGGVGGVCGVGGLLEGDLKHADDAGQARGLVGVSHVSTQTQDDVKSRK